MASFADAPAGDLAVGEKIFKTKCARESCVTLFGCGAPRAEGTEDDDDDNDKGSSSLSPPFSCVRLSLSL